MAKVTPEMCKLISEGIKSIAAIAEEAGVSRQAVFAMMKKYAGAAPKAEPKKIKKTTSPAPKAE